jgi:NAD(P)H-dependent flavin oxidoreductase YrpB (nitropropane dioxygenase family)
MLPVIIQGGMGVAVSGWSLARAVSLAGHMGVVSGTALDSVVVRRLQDGDPGGDIRRAMAAFPYPEIVEKTLKRFFLKEGRPEGKGYVQMPMFRKVTNRFREQVTALSNFVEVYLAKEGHDGLIGINFLTKIQLPTLPSIYGAMLAGVDYVVMGAGIPKDIPGVLDRLAIGKPVDLPMEIKVDSREDAETLKFDPSDWGSPAKKDLLRPKFLPIIAATSLASMMTRRSNGRVDGFVIEGPTAGGHNAPPRGPKRFTERGEPAYGPRDEVSLETIAESGLPFWLAGGQGTPEGLASARASGAAGVQVGTLFAYCDESGFTPDLKKHTLERCVAGTADVFTDGRASPTGFPFKVVALEGSLSEKGDYEKRNRICDLGYLRTATKSKGRIIYRCASEPVDQFIAKGGTAEDADGRKCLCNALMANIGLGQEREDGSHEEALLTSGDDLTNLAKFLNGRTSYTASDVLQYLTGGKDLYADSAAQEEIASPAGGKETQVNGQAAKAVASS